MRKPDPVFVAMQEFIWMRSDGSQLDLHARVGIPYIVEEGGWACPAELEGIDGRFPDIVGESSMQALNLAIRLIAKRLGHLIENEEHITHAGQPLSKLNMFSLEIIFGKF